MRRWSGIVLAALALLPTYLFGWGLYDALTGDYVCGEVGIVWTITGVVRLVTVALWACTFAALSNEQRTLRTFGLLGVAAAVALLVGVAVGFITDTTDDVTLEVILSTDVDEGFLLCSEESGIPDEVPAGDVDIVFYNQASTGGTGWMDLIRLDEDKTLSDVNGYIESGASGTPDWAVRVYLADFVPPTSSTDPVTRTVEPGLHVIICGFNTPYESRTAGAFNVLP